VCSCAPASCHADILAELIEHRVAGERLDREFDAAKARVGEMREAASLLGSLRRDGDAGPGVQAVKVKIVIVPRETGVEFNWQGLGEGDALASPMFHGTEQRMYESLARLKWDQLPRVVEDMRGGMDQRL
jgi:hypothetical protein